jgi:hypothetical protein
MKQGLAAALFVVLLSLSHTAMAGPQMGTANNTVTRSVDDAGGATASTANNQITGVIAEEVAVTTAASTNNKLCAGWSTIASYPNALTALTTRSDNTVSSATFQWATPGYDGGLGNIQLGSSYYIQVASYTVPSVFSNVAFTSVKVSTGGNSLAVGAGVGAGVQGLVPNTTYFVQLWTLDNDGDVSLPFMSTFTSLANAPVLGASEFLSIQTASSTVSSATVTVAWVALPASPPDASSKTAEGYVLIASSNNFGALGGNAPEYSSTTYSVLSSTLTLGTTVPLDLSNTYYFQVASLNWAGQPNYTTLPRLNFQIAQSTALIHLGAIDPYVARSTVSTSSMVVTNVGNWPVTIGLWASTATLPVAHWTIATSSGVDAVSLLGAWNSGPPGPAASAFTTNLTATPTFSQNAGNYAANQSGFQVAPGQSVTLWLLFWLPTTSSTVGPETFRVTPQPVYP